MATSNCWKLMILIYLISIMATKKSFIIHWYQSNNINNTLQNKTSILSVIWLSYEFVQDDLKIMTFNRVWQLTPNKIYIQLIHMLHAQTLDSYYSMTSPHSCLLKHMMSHFLGEDTFQLQRIWSNFFQPGVYNLTRDDHLNKFVNK